MFKILGECLSRTTKVNESGKRVSVFLSVPQKMNVFEIHFILDSSHDSNIEYSVFWKNSNKVSKRLGKVTSSSSLFQFLCPKGVEFEKGQHEFIFIPLNVQNELHDTTTFDISLYDN